MEITEYLRQAGPRKWLLLLLPLVAGGAVAPYAVSQPVKYESSTTVQLQAYAADPSPAVIKQVVDSYQAVVTSDITTNPVADRYKLPRGDVAGGTTFTRQADGEVVTVGYSGKDPATVAKVSEALARTALATTQQRDLDIADNTVKAFQAQRDTAYKALTAYIAKGGPASLPEDDYKTTSRDVAELQRQITTFTVVGKDTKDLKAQLAADVKTLPAKRDRFVQYQQLDAALTRANAALADAQSRLTNVSVRRSVAGDGAAAFQQVRPGVATKVSPLPLILQYVVGAAVIGFLVAALLLVLLEAFGRRRRTSRRGRQGGEQPTTSASAPPGSGATEATAAPRAAAENQALTRS